MNSKHRSAAPIPDAFLRAADQLHFLERVPSYAGELRRLLGHRDLRAQLWPQALGPIAKGEDPDEFAYQLLLTIVVKGGAMPPEVLSEKRKRRQRIAAQMGRLRAAIKRDRDLRAFHLTNWLDLAGTEATQRILATFREPRYDERSRDPFVGIIVREALAREPLTLFALLESLEHALRSFQPLGETDDVTHARYPGITPKPGLVDAQQRLLERQLCKLFEGFTRTPRYALVAIAVSAVFGKEVDSAEIASRHREYRRRALKPK